MIASSTRRFAERQGVMGAKTEISWTDATWNPWHGCHKVSAGCKNCYMFSDKARYGQDPNKVVRSKTKFQEPVKWLKGRRIFTCSWSDWFIEEADEWRDEAYTVIHLSGQHTYQILTKRIERASGRIPLPVLPNLWLGVSCENQTAADVRIPYLLKTPAAVKFISYEPALEYVDFSGWFQAGKIDWLIFGGESGPGARACNVDWAYRVRRQCQDAGVAFFMKQEGAKPWYGGDGDLSPNTGNLILLKDRKGADPLEWPPELRVQEFPR